MENFMDYRDRYLKDQLTEEEKWDFLKSRDKACINICDKEFIPYLIQINNFDFIMTTGCCSGHNKPNHDFLINQKVDAYLDLDYRINHDDVMKYLILPFIQRKTNQKGITINKSWNDPDTKIGFTLWFYNKTWKEDIEIFIQILQEYEITLNKLTK